MARKSRLIDISILFLCIVGVATKCTSGLLCEPVVVSTNSDYTTALLPYSDTHAEFAENCSGQDLSISLRDDIIKSMMRKADDLGEDSEILYRCIKITYPDWDVRPMRIPCYAEKCIYENQSAWGIAFNRANSFDESTLDHFDIFFVSCSDYDILHYYGCFKDDNLE